MCNAPGTFMSLVKTASPVSRTGSSLRRTRVPITLVDVSSMTVMLDPHPVRHTVPGLT